MALSLLAGPANAGKVALLLERYLGALESDPVLIVPNRPDVDRAERELLARSGALLGGSIGTFDDLFERVARGNGAHRPVVTEAQRTLLLRRVVARAAVRSARFAGFADALGSTVAELESALVEPGELDGELAELYAAYREELDRLNLWDRELERRHAAERVAGELSAWDGRPVFAYGFEDLTGAEWSLLEALAGRSDVTVSLPYEPGRDAFASLSRTAEDLAALAQDVEELPADPGARSPVLAHLERSLFGTLGAAPELDGSLRFLEGAGLRGTLELVADETLTLLRSGRPADPPPRGDAPPRGFGGARRGDRRGLPGPRPLARRAGHRLRPPRHPVRAGGPRPPRPDPVRPGAARTAPLRVAGRRPPRP